MVRRGRRHLRLPARCADARFDQAGPAAAQRAAGAPLCAEAAAFHRSVDGQVAGGHRVLSLSPPARVERGRRRSRGESAFRCGLPPDDANPHAGMAARHDRDRDPRHQARRGRPRAADGAVRNPRRMDQRSRALDGEMRAPSAAMEYMLYQTLLGAWSLEGPDAAFVERVQAYALKAAREGKEQTSWLNPHTTYEAEI